MDFSDNVILLPYTRMFSAPLYEAILHDKSICENINDTDISPEEHKGPIYDMYYDGMWQKPVKGKYWIQEGCLWANATMYTFLFDLDLFIALMFEKCLRKYVIKLIDIKFAICSFIVVEKMFTDALIQLRKDSKFGVLGLWILEYKYYPN